MLRSAFPLAASRTRRGCNKALRRTTESYLGGSRGRSTTKLSSPVLNFTSHQYGIGTKLPNLQRAENNAFGSISKNEADSMRKCGVQPVYNMLGRPQSLHSVPMSKRILSPHIYGMRWMSSGKEKPKEKPKEEETVKSKETANESLDPRAFFLGTRESLRKVADMEVGDMVATYTIGFLLLGILLSPIVGRYMRGSENTYEELDTDDPVVDMARVLRRDYLEMDGELEDKGVVDSVLADVLSSKALQEQAIKFVVTIVQSPQVKAACQQLLQDLWTDLVQDPETTAQIIFVLNVAIQNEDIRLAVKKLVLDIIDDEEVLEELVRLLQKLGHDQEVLEATKSLLTQSTHNTLNDPEILDHSMEFATDVVGDDVVQRTAGEALRNSVSYAVQPSISLVLATAGVGLLFFSVMSLGYARSSEKDAKVLDEAVVGLARSLQPNQRFWDRLGKLVCLPFEAVGTFANAMFSTALLPFQFVQHTLARVEYTYVAARKGIEAAVTWICNAMASVLSLVSSRGRAVSGSLMASVEIIASQVQAAAGFLRGIWSWAGHWFGSLYPWWAAGSEKVADMHNSLARGVSSRAWVVMDSACRFLDNAHGYIIAVHEFIFGKNRI